MSAVIQKSNPMLGRDPYSIPLDEYDVAQADLFETNSFWPFFKRLREEDPVHYCKSSEHGPYWSVTKYKDIMTVESDPDTYSSAQGISLLTRAVDNLQTSSFIRMDEPGHGQQRKTVQGVVAPTNLALLEPLIRSRVGDILDSLPIGETFNWVERVSIELTTQMLATLFDFPFEERHKLTFWSDVATSAPGPEGLVGSDEEREEVMLECLAAFTEIWNERVNAPPQNDLISMLAHGEATRNMKPMEFLGNLILLIIGGNDTTRNSLSGGVLALNQNPDQYQKLRDNPELIPKLVPEIIRWQTPLTHMMRVATCDTILAGKQIKKDDKVVMWYVSGNRDEEMVERANEFIIDRAKPRQHLSFGFGIHRCMGNRLAEMQIRIAWEEIQKRFSFVEVVGEPVRNHSTFIKGFAELPVKVHAV